MTVTKAKDKVLREKWIINDCTSVLRRPKRPLRTREIGDNPTRNAGGDSSLSVSFVRRVVAAVAKPSGQQGTDNHRSQATENVQSCRA